MIPYSVTPVMLTTGAARAKALATMATLPFTLRFREGQERPTMTLMTHSNPGTPYALWPQAVPS